MTPRDDRVSPSTSTRPSRETDVQTDRAVPEPTVLSTVWEGPTEGRSTDGSDADPQALDLEASEIRAPILRWLFAPTSRRRALIITMAAALACGGLFAVREAAEPVADSTDASPVQAVEATRRSLSSRALADDPVDGLAGERSVEAEPPSGPSSLAREAVSADDRLRITANTLNGAERSWMLEAQVLDPAGAAPIVKYSVNGVAVGEVEQAPYRLVLGPELLAAFPNAVDAGQPLVVTASALWPGDRETASPATVVLPS